MRTAVAWYSLAVGISMIVWWTIDLRGGALQRPDRTRAEMALHLAAELLTAVALVAGGVVLLFGGGTAVVLVALGMLLYTVVQSPGYFVARRERVPVVMFASLQALTLAAIVTLVV